MNTKNYNDIFDKVIADYHLLDTVDQPLQNPFDSDENLLAHLLYKKCWIDTVQWHYEDLIRLPHIDPVEALALKRKIDASNQERTDVVEYIDAYFLKLYEKITPQKNATINTESPAWAIDRLSILALKLYHMKEEAKRKDVGEMHFRKCNEKLTVLKAQRTDLSKAIDELLEAIEKGDKYMKVYKQMKMYNDDSLNPVLYRKY